jgi:hypothetical protein
MEKPIIQFNFGGRLERFAFKKGRRFSLNARSETGVGS